MRAWFRCTAKVQQLTPLEDDSDDDDDDDEDTDDQDVTRRRPTPSCQRRAVSRAQTQTDGGGTHTYAVARVWYRRWEEYVGAARGFVAGSAAAPGPVDMDTQNDDANAFVNESVWKLLVAWYGVAATHHLDRKHLYFKDEKVISDTIVCNENITAGHTQVPIFTAPCY